MDKKNLVRILWPTLWLGFLAGLMTAFVILFSVMDDPRLIQPEWWFALLIALPITGAALLFVPLARLLAWAVLSDRNSNG